MPPRTFFIGTSDEVVLIDAGDKKRENVGLLEANLRRIGVKSSDVTLIILTHAHPASLGPLSARTAPFGMKPPAVS